MPSIWDTPPVSNPSNDDSYIPSAAETPQFAQRISVEEYNKQKNDFTQKALAELARQMEAAKHFKKMQRENGKKENKENSSQNNNYKSPKPKLKKVFTTPVKKLLRRSSKKKQKRNQELEDLKDQVKNLTEQVSKISFGEEFYDPENVDSSKSSSPPRRARYRCSSTPIRTPLGERTAASSGAPPPPAPPLPAPATMGAPPPPPPPLPDFNAKTPKSRRDRPKRTPKSKSLQSASCSAQNDLQAELKKKLEMRKKKLSSSNSDGDQKKHDAEKSKQNDASTGLNLGEKRRFTTPQKKDLPKKTQPTLEDVLQERKAALQKKMEKSQKSENTPIQTDDSIVKSENVQKQTTAAPVEIRTAIQQNTGPSKKEEHVQAPLQQVKVEEPTHSAEQNIQKEKPPQQVSVAKSSESITQSYEGNILKENPCPKQPAKIASSAISNIPKQVKKQQPKKKVKPQRKQQQYKPLARAPLSSPAKKNSSTASNSSKAEVPMLYSMAGFASLSAFNFSYPGMPCAKAQTPKETSNIPPAPPLCDSLKVKDTTDTKTSTEKVCTNIPAAPPLPASLSEPEKLSTTPKGPSPSQEIGVKAPLPRTPLDEIKSFRRSSLRPVTPNLKSPTMSHNPMTVDTQRFSLQDALRKKFQSLALSPDSDAESGDDFSDDDF